MDDDQGHRGRLGGGPQLGKAARFFQALGFELEFETDHHSGQLRNGDGPYVFIAEVPTDKVPGIQLVLQVADADEFRPDPAIEVVTPFEDTHYGTKEMTVRDLSRRRLYMDVLCCTLGSCQSR